MNKRDRLFKLFFWMSFIILTGSSCGNRIEKPTPLNLKIPKGFPTILNIPEDNPMTVEGVALGKILFEDGHLCGFTGDNPDSLMCCATCHVKANNYDIGIDNPRFKNGIAVGRTTGKSTIHNVMPLTNLVFNREGYFWNGAIASYGTTHPQNIEDIVLMAITAEDEMCSTPERTVAAIRANKMYPELFKKAFGTEEITIERIQKAIAQYVRSLISCDSKFDRYLQGLEQLTPQELHGYILFTTEEGADCFHCHGSDGSPLFTTNLFYNNGLDNVFTDAHDRYSVTHNENDHGRYRAPSLRNVAVSAPYMHDGRFKTLDEVLMFYNNDVNFTPYVDPLMHKAPEGGAHLTPSDIADLKAFLMTLTDYSYLNN